MKYNEETFKAKIKELYNNELTIIGHFKNLARPLLVQDKYGVMKVPNAGYLLKCRPTIKAALNKTEYFMSQLKEVQPEIFSELSPASEYLSAKSKMLFKTKFGIIAQTPDNLMHGHIPTIVSAVNRKDYFKNQLLLLYDNKYDFETLSTDRHHGRVILKCPIHGSQMVDNDYIFTGCGCPKCNHGYHKSNIFYIIKLSNKEESFYKLGISQKLQNGDISRFRDYKRLGFDIQVLALLQFKEALECKQFEDSLKKIIKPFLYKPKTWDYKNSTETFQEGLLTGLLTLINNVKYDIVSSSMKVEAVNKRLKSNELQ